MKTITGCTSPTGLHNVVNGICTRCGESNEPEERGSYLRPDEVHTRDDCVACDGAGQTAQEHDGAVTIELCDICGGSGVDR